nr:hypothetical protein [uncultured Undibacterium sp.]
MGIKTPKNKQHFERLNIEAGGKYSVVTALSNAISASRGRYSKLKVMPADQ